MSFGVDYTISSKQSSNLFNRGLLFFSLAGIAFFCFLFFAFSSDAKSLYDTKRLFVVLVTGLSTVGVLFSAQYRERVIEQIFSLSRPVKYLLSVIGLSAIFANATGWYFLRAQTDFFYFIGLAILTFNLALVVPKYRSASYAFYALFVVFSFVSVAMGHLGSVFILDTQPTVFSIVNFTNPRMLNQLMIWTLIPTLYMAIIARRHVKRGWMAMIPLSLNFAIMFASDARGFAISAIGSVVIWASVDPYLRRDIIRKTVQALIAGYLIKFVFLSPLPAYIVLGELADILEVRADSSGRIALWKEAISMITVFGHGGDTFVCNSTAHARPHNSVLLMAVSWGVIAALSYIGLMLYGFTSILKEKNRKVMVAGITMLSGFAYSLVSGVLDSPLSQLGAVLAIALFWGEIYRRKRYTLKTSGANRLAVRSAHGLLMLSALLFIGLVGYKVYLRIENNAYRHIEQPTYNPQFWLGQNCMDAARKIGMKDR